MDNWTLILSRSQIPHILNTESRCLTDRCIIQAIEQLPRDRILVAIGRRYDIPNVETIW
ncbi:hypothetical protein QUA08_19545 [Microcoleus sp. T3B2]